jgi:hypothetical protein
MHTVKRGDTKTLRWNLGRDLSGVTEAKVIVKPDPAATPAVQRNGTIDDAVGGIVSLPLIASDYDVGKLYVRPDPFLVEVQTQPGPLTHPDDGYELIYVVADLA